MLSIKYLFTWSSTFFIIRYCIILEIKSVVMKPDTHGHGKQQKKNPHNHDKDVHEKVHFII